MKFDIEIKKKIQNQNMNAKIMIRADNVISQA